MLLIKTKNPQYEIVDLALELVLRSTATELRTFFSTVSDYDLSQLLNLEYLDFGDYKWKVWKPVSDYRIIRGKDGKCRRQMKKFSNKRW